MDFHFRIKKRFKNVNVAIVFYKKKICFLWEKKNRKFRIRSFRIRENI